MLFALQLLLAEAAPAAADTPQGSPFSGILNFAPILAMGLLAWLFLFRPMKKQEQQRQALINALKKNDRVVTSCGIIGTVANIKEKEDEVTLKVEEGRLRVTKSSIVRVLGGEDAAKEQKNGGAGGWPSRLS